MDKPVNVDDVETVSLTSQATDDAARSVVDALRRSKPCGVRA